MVEPKTAIACRDEVEKKVVLDILKREGHMIDNVMKIQDVSLRIYVCPEGYRGEYAQSDNDDLEYTYGSDIDDYEYCDEDDPFEWNYVEASDMFRNQIISARLKGE